MRDSFFKWPILLFFWKVRTILIADTRNDISAKSHSETFFRIYNLSRHQQSCKKVQNPP